MTKPKLVFDPYSQEYFDNPYEIYRQMLNRNPRAFDDGETFDIARDRTQAQNLGLGYGIHSCLGAALARLETTIALEHLLDFMPRYEVDFDILQRVHMQNVAGYQNVPVRVMR